MSRSRPIAIAAYRGSRGRAGRQCGIRAEDTTLPPKDRDAPSLLFTTLTLHPSGCNNAKAGIMEIAICCGHSDGVDCRGPLPREEECTASASGFHTADLRVALARRSIVADTAEPRQNESRSRPGSAGECRLPSADTASSAPAQPITIDGEKGEGKRESRRRAGLSRLSPSEGYARRRETHVLASIERDARSVYISQHQSSNVEQ
jgi:hypothetical protein